jgi:hypothetical protein
MTGAQYLAPSTVLYRVCITVDMQIIFFNATDPADQLVAACARCALFPDHALGSPAFLAADNASPCRKTLGRMLLHPLGELRRAHQAGLHRNISEVRGGDGLLVAICRSRETAEHSDDLDHERPPSLR